MGQDLRCVGGAGAGALPGTAGEGPTAVYGLRRERSKAIGAGRRVCYDAGNGSRQDVRSEERASWRRCAMTPPKIRNALVAINDSPADETTMRLACTIAQSQK